MKINDYDRMAFNVDHRLMSASIVSDGWVAVNKQTGMEVTPVFKHPQEAILFVVRNILNKQINECIEEMLNEHIRS